MSVPMRLPAATAALAVALGLGPALAGCDGLDPPVPAAIRLDPQSVELAWGRHSASVTATLLDQHGAVFDDWPAGFSAGWSVADTTVAITNTTLRVASVRAVGGGQTLLTAAPAGLSPASVPITVMAAPDTISGEISFVYDGDHAGIYGVGGAWPFDHGDADYLHTLEYLRDQGGWVAATNPGSLTVYSRRIRPDGRDDALAIRVDGPVVGPGTYAIRESALDLGWDRRGGVIVVEASYMHTGEGGITVAAVTETRVRGTFSFPMRMQLFSGVVHFIQVDGSFDAPLVSGQP
jgi:hypothetical protein